MVAKFPWLHGCYNPEREKVGGMGEHMGERVDGMEVVAVVEEGWEEGGGECSSKTIYLSGKTMLLSYDSHPLQSFHPYELLIQDIECTHYLVSLDHQVLQPLHLVHFYK